MRGSVVSTGGIFGVVTVSIALVRPLAAAEEPPVSVRGTETLIMQYVGDNGPANEARTGDDDDTFMLRNLFYLQAGNSVIDTSMRLDAAMFQDPPPRVDLEDFRPGGDGYTLLDYGNDYRVERLAGTINLGNLHVTGGDFYVSFGRGIALSLIKLDDVGVDNTLRGARVEYGIPRHLRFVLVGGVVNSLNLDPITHQVLRDDPLDRIVGARVEWEIADAAVLGLHGVFLRPRFDDESLIAEDRLDVDRGAGVGALSGGASAELNVAGLHLYLEGNGQEHDNDRPPEGTPDVHGESGYGAFGELSYDAQPFNVKAEGIFYKRWLMEGPLRGTGYGLSQPISYNHMVTLEPLWMVIKSFGNAGGGKLTFDWYRKASDTNAVLAAATIKYEGGLMPDGTWTDHPPTAVVHPTLKLRQGFGESGVSATAEGGYRHEWSALDDTEGQLWHVAADVTVPLTGPHSIEVKGEVRRHMLEVTEGNRYWVAMGSLGYDMAGLLGLTAIYEYSDETAGADVAFGDWEYPLPRRHYLWGVASLHVPAPLDGLTLRLTAGSQRGGIKCAGGVCRNYPDAVGATLEAVYRF
ncbi:MAG: hypothetical protein PHU25_16880 [Deltaproteobacteria bacterium]|nr:hypothetical protein [Deltaproteobacteria bacterium]